MSRHPWTAAQIAFLRQHAAQWSLPRLTRELNERFALFITPSRVASACRRHTIPRPRLEVQQPKRLWTSQQLDYIGTCYRATADLSAIAARLLLDYGIQRTPGQIRAAINRNGLTSGRDTTFRPGARPWNAGLKGRNGTSNTTFKPGNCPPNRQPLGHLRTGRGGYQEIKVAEPNPYTGHATRYRALHVLRWEQAHGRSVPPGHCVIFIDGDPAHCDPDNLCLVERAELLRINHNGHADLPKELRPQAITLARVQTAISRAARPRNHAAEPDHVPG